MERRRALKVNKIKIVVEPLDKFVESIDTRIEKAIKRGKETHTLEISVGAYDDIFKILTPERIRIIHAIREKKPRSISELANILNRNRRAVATDLEILNTYGIIEIEEARDNGRVVAIPHTPKALEIRV